MQNICLVGASGRMGIAISELLPSSTNVLPYSRLQAKNFDAFVASVSISLGVIDISHPDNIKFAIDACLSANKPYLCCTTGLEGHHFEMLRTASSSIPVLYAANTSIGIAILKKAVELVTKAWGDDVDITICETHHRFKKDAPSGTALELGRVITQAGHSQAPDYVSMRGGHSPGKHAVHFFHGDETLRLTHQCLNRNVFASGAIKAATWLFKQPPGFYNLEDTLN